MNRKENENIINLLILGNSKSVYIKNLTSNLNSKGVNVELLDCKKLIHKDFSEDIEKKLNRFLPNISGIPKITKLIRFFYLRNFLNNRKSHYDVCNIHSINIRYISFLKYIKNSSKFLVTTIWGSDYLRASDNIRQKQKEIYDASDKITFNNEVIMQEFIDFYRDRYKQKTCIKRFGQVVIDSILNIENQENLDESKLKMGFKKKTTIITCGNNASKSQQHEKIIRSLLLLKDVLPDNVVFVFPMTYGNQNLIFKIESILEKSGLNFRIIKNFMNDTDVARLRRITDIVINVQTTDQLSGTMQEALYANCILITGKWLPYKVFRDRGIEFFEVDSVDQVGQKVTECIKNIKKYKQICEKNKALIWEMSSWDKNTDKWINLYKELIRNEPLLKKDS